MPSDGSEPPHPGSALLPGLDDPRRVITIWLVRRAGVLVGLLGIIGLAFERTDADVSMKWKTLGELASDLKSPVAGLILGGLLRVGGNGIALLMTWPLVQRYEAQLPPRGPDGHVGLMGWMDRLGIARGFRAWRYTHHVRTEAMTRLGASGRTLARIHRASDIALVVLVVAAIASAIVFTALS